jgi:hypothetical protein
MADDGVGLPDEAEGRTAREDEGVTPERDDATAESRPTEVAVVRVGGSPAVRWRQRALAVRTAAPQLARNPVVVGASAAVASIALRVAVDAAQRALGASASARPRDVAVTGSILHEVHVVRHVHVIHHVVHHHYPYGALPPWSRWPPP